VPPEAKEFAIVLFDPDAPNGGFLHWIVFKIPATATSLPEGSLPAGARQSQNGAGRKGYIGPCPPAGNVHHYEFRVSALRSPVDLPDGAPMGEARTQIASRAIVDGVLVGLYRRH